jgi:hypothetical protein
MPVHTQSGDRDKHLPRTNPTNQHIWLHVEWALEQLLQLVEGSGVQTVVLFGLMHLPEWNRFCFILHSILGLAFSVKWVRSFVGSSHVLVSKMIRVIVEWNRK